MGSRDGETYSMSVPDAVLRFCKGGDNGYVILEDEGNCLLQDINTWRHLQSLLV